jgi:nitroreductase
MTDFMKILKERRSIRRYEEKDIPEEMLTQIFEAVQWSPSWANTQCWEVVAVKNLSIKEKLQEALAPKNPATKAVVAAPVVLALCGKLNSSGYYSNQVTTVLGDWYMFDLGIATQSICLTAHSLGLGTVIVGLFDHKKVGEILNVPQGYQVVTLIPVGFPAKESPAPKRRELSEFVHHDGF